MPGFSGSLNGCLLGYSAEYRDPVSAAYPLGSGYRSYLPGLMRFTKPDSSSPFGAGGINPYAYCEDDPINGSDPSGHFFMEALVGSIFGGTAMGVLGANAMPAIREARAIASVVPESPAGQLHVVARDAMARAPKRATAAVAGFGSGALAVAAGIGSHGVSTISPEIASMLATWSLVSGSVAIGAAIAPVVSMMKNASRREADPEALANALQEQVDPTAALERYRPSYLHVETGDADTLLPPHYSDSFSHGNPPPVYVEYAHDDRPPLNTLTRRRALSAPSSSQGKVSVPPSRLRSHTKTVMQNMAQENPRLLHSAQNPWGARLLDPELDVG